MTPRRLLWLAACGLSAMVAAAWLAADSGSGTKPTAAATLYERIDARLAADPAVAASLSRPSAEVAAMAWMVGSWEVEVKVLATAGSPERISKGKSEVRPAMGGHWLETVDTYPDGSIDQGFLGYSTADQQWVTVALHSGGIAVTAYAKTWNAGTMVFLAPDATILGVPVDLRQTLTRRGDDEYFILNEERLADGRWVALDEYAYRRIKDSAS